jgi:predicted nucleic acid-binding protein
VTIVLDACAAIAYLRREPGWEMIAARIEDPAAVCLIHAVNACEVLYGFARAEGAAAGRSAIADLQTVGVTVCEEIGEDIWVEAGRIKAAYPIAIADCFCVALGRRERAEVLTTDRGEFGKLDPVDGERIASVR